MRSRHSCITAQQKAQDSLWPEILNNVKMTDKSEWAFGLIKIA